MKNLLPITLLFLMFILAACSNQGTTKKAMFSSSNVNSNTVLLNQTEFDSLINDFSNRYPESTLGGILSKDSLNVLLSQMPEDSSFVNYIFCTDTTYNKVSLAMRSSAKNESDTNLYCYRNSRTADAFCPNNCNLEC